MTINAFIKKHKVRLTAEMVGENPNCPDWTDAYHYKCILRCGNRQMTLYFSQGYAICKEPSAASVLECLQSDSHCDGQSFEEWCSDLGFDTYSREAVRAYNNCIKQTEKFKRLLGEDALEKISGIEW